MSINNNPGSSHRFSANDRQETARRLRSVNVEVPETEQSFPRKKRCIDRLEAFQKAVNRRIGAPRVTVTNSRPFYSLILMTGSILQGLFPVHLIGRAARSTIRRIRASFSTRSSRVYRDHGVQTEEGAVAMTARKEDDSCSTDCPENK